jgi:two-component system, cell cycle sensor histidine kinase and response regulator CckA
MNMTAIERSPDLSAIREEEPLRILVAEDDVSVRRLICRRLEQAGLETIAAASGEEAIAAYESAVQPIHVLVTDGIMPGMDGFELARYFVRHDARIRAILISGFMGHFVSRPDIPENIEAFFPKPFSGEELVAKILVLVEPHGR